MTLNKCLEHSTAIQVFTITIIILGQFPGGSSSKESTCQGRRHKRHGFHPWVRKIPWNGNLLQSSCLENPMNRGAWWATAQGVTELDTTESEHTHTHHQHHHHHTWMGHVSSAMDLVHEFNLEQLFLGGLASSPLTQKVSLSPQIYFVGRNSGSRQ